MAVDCWDNPRFREMHEILDSRIDYRQLDMYELTPERIGKFDIVLFMGVLYHLKDPVTALQRVASVCNDLLMLETETALNFMPFPAARLWPTTARSLVTS